MHPPDARIVYNLCAVYLSRAGNLSRSLGRMLTSDWSAEFERTMNELRASIVEINATRVEVAPIEQLLDLVQNAVGWLSHWGGAVFWIFLAIVICGGLIIYIRRMRKQVHQQQHMLVQAMAALKAGASPQVWLNMLDR